MQYTVAIDGVNVSISQLNIVTTVDRTLDYGSFLVRNKIEEAFDVGTLVDIDVTDGVDTLNYHFIIQADDVQKIKGGTFIHSIEIIELTKILEWHTESVRSFTQIVDGPVLTLFDIVIRLQRSIPMELDSEVFNTRIFALDPVLAETLKEIEAPEFVFANKNLKEMLMEIFDFIGALPRLVKVSNSVVLTADFYNKRNNEITENEFSRMERFNINDFSTALDADLKNLFDSYTEVVEPAPNQFKKLYAEGGDFSQENLILKTDYPIIDIVSLKVQLDILPAEISNINNPGASGLIVRDAILDLTPVVLERELWENLSNAGFSSSFERGRFRDNTLFFTRFQPSITNIYDVVGAFANAPIVAGSERLEAAIQRALELSDLTYEFSGTTRKLRFGAISNYADIKFQIIYKAQLDSRTEVKRLDTRRIKFESQSYTGQIDNVVRADRVLDKLFKTQQLLGNAEIMTSERVKDLDAIFNLGDYTDDDYILTTSELQFDKNFITAKYMWTQNFNKVSEFIGLNSAIRLFPIPNDTYQRNVYVEDFIELGTSSVANDGELTNDGLNTFMNTFSNSPSSSFNQPITNIAFDNPSVPSFITADNVIIKPVTAYAGGNSINFHFQFDNPSVAGWQINTVEQTLTQNIDEPDADEQEAKKWFETVWDATRIAWNALLRTPTVPGVANPGPTIARAIDNIVTTSSTITAVFKKPIVNGVYYVDDNGNVLRFSFQFLNGVTINNSNRLPIVPKTDLGTKMVQSGEYLVFKDAREELAMTFALHVVPEPGFEKTFIIGKYLVERNNLLKSIDISNNQFEVFTSTEEYNIHENQLSRDTDTVSSVTYTIIGTQNNVLFLSQNITNAPVWGIRKKTTNELVIAVNQGDEVIREVHFNVRDRKSAVTYPEQPIFVEAPVLRIVNFNVITALTTSSTVNLEWTDPNSPNADDYELGFSNDLVNFTTEIVTGTSRQITGLESETIFTFRIRARIDGEVGEYVYAEEKTLPVTPAGPQNLVGNLAGERNILLNWDAVPNVTLYSIEVSENSNFTPLITGGLISTFNNYFSLSHIFVPAITFNTTYFIRVRALSGAIASGFSNVVQVTTSDNQLTSAPIITNVQQADIAGGDALQFTLINTDRNSVTFFADFFSGSTQRATNVLPNESRDFTIAFGASDTTVFARAQAVGKRLSPIVSESFIALDPPGTPTIGGNAIEAFPGFNDVQFVYLSGVLPRVDGFVVERNPDGNEANQFGIVSEQLAPQVRRFFDRNVVSGKFYTYRIVAFNRAGEKTSNQVSVTSLITVPAAPSSLTLTDLGISGGPGEAAIELKWTRNSSNEIGFIIQRKISGQPNTTYINVASTGVGVVERIVGISGPQNTQYTFRVIAFNQFGESGPSNEQSIFVS